MLVISNPNCTKNTSRPPKKKLPVTRVLIIKPFSLVDIIHGLESVERFKTAKPDWHTT